MNSNNRVEFRRTKHEIHENHTCNHKPHQCLLGQLAMALFYFDKFLQSHQVLITFCWFSKSEFLVSNHNKIHCTVFLYFSIHLWHCCRPGNQSTFIHICCTTIKSLICRCWWLFNIFYYRCILLWLFHLSFFFFVEFPSFSKTLNA